MVVSNYKLKSNRDLHTVDTACKTHRYNKRLGSWSIPLPRSMLRHPTTMTNLEHFSPGQKTGCFGNAFNKRGQCPSQVYRGTFDVDIWTAPGVDSVTKNCKGHSALAWWRLGKAR